MNTAEDVSAFLSQKTLAVVGVSRNKDAFSVKAYADLKAKGYRVIPVNPNADRIGGDVCYPSVSVLPEKVGGVLLFTPAHETERLIAVSGQCIYMFAEPVSSLHAFHRWFWRLFGKLPKAERTAEKKRG
jgi:predicted CoA-binding protein